MLGTVEERNLVDSDAKQLGRMSERFVTFYYAGRANFLCRMAGNDEPVARPCENLVSGAQSKT